MFSIKYRKSKASQQQTQVKKRSVTTVDAKHKEMISKFDNLYTKVLPQKEKQLAAKEKQLQKLESKKQLEPIEFNQKKEIQKEIDLLKQEIADIENRTEEKNYLLNVSGILKKYNDIRSSAKKEAPVKKEQNIMDMFANFEKPQSQDKGKITSYIKIHESDEQSRGEVLDEFLRVADPNYVSTKKIKKKITKCNCRNPNDSNIIFDFTTGRNICETCGTVLDHFFDSQFTSYKESQDHDIPVDFPYVRINHFNELIAQFQAKEQTDIPQDVFDALHTEFRKDRKLNFDELTYQFVKSKLKKLGMSNMYEHIPYIIHKFNGLPPPVLTLEEEQEFRKMFKQIQGPFEKHKYLAKKSRKNFLSYSYVFYKFAELLELDDLLRCFRLLKSREKLFAQDKVWKAICQDMQWYFYPSL